MPLFPLQGKSKRSSVGQFSVLIVTAHGTHILLRSFQTLFIINPCRRLRTRLVFHYQTTTVAPVSLRVYSSRMEYILIYIYSSSIVKWMIHSNSPLNGNFEIILVSALFTSITVSHPFHIRMLSDGPVKFCRQHYGLSMTNKASGDNNKNLLELLEKTHTSKSARTIIPEQGWPNLCCVQSLRPRKSRCI